MKEQGRVAGVVIEDRRSGLRHTIRARAVINAGGVWADELQQLAGANTFSVQPAKGVHLLLRADAIDADTGLLARAADSVIIARRWYGYWLVGTTDTVWTGSKSRPVAEAADVNYLLRNLNRYLQRKVERSHILGTFAGLRPLLKPVGEHGATSALSRDHAVIPGPPGLTTIVGGKYTTYRLMAADAVDAASADLGSVAASSTADLPLIGAARWDATRGRAGEIATRTGLTEAAVVNLLKRHGDRVDDVLGLAANNSALGQPLAGAPQYLAAELVHAVEAEGAQTLADVLVRRTHLSIELPDGGIGIAPQAAELVAASLGWNEATAASEVERYRAFVRAERTALEAP